MEHFACEDDKRELQKSIGKALAVIECLGRLAPMVEKGVKRARNPPACRPRKPAPRRGGFLTRNKVVSQHVLVGRCKTGGGASRNKGPSSASHLLLQGGDGLAYHILAHAECLKSVLIELLKLPDLANVWIGRCAGAELASALSGESHFCVTAWAWVAAGTGGEDGLLDGGHGRDGGEEDQLEALRERHG